MISDGLNGWEAIFRQRSQEMKAEEAILSKESPEHGLISFQPDRKCQNCGQLGLYTGIAIFGGHLYDAINADYCPSCEHIHKLRASNPMLIGKPDSFLPVITQRLIDYPELEPETTPGEPCPICQATTRILKIRPGKLDGYSHQWRVCTTGCGWPGEHRPIL